MKTKKDILKNSLASVLAGLLWVAIIGALPFIEEMIYPAQDTNDSWQRGLVLLPILLLISAPLLYFISTMVVEKGWIKLSSFILASSISAGIIGATVIIPSVLVMAYAGMTSVAESFQIALYGLILISLTALPPAMLWWLLRKKSFIKAKTYLAQ